MKYIRTKDGIVSDKLYKQALEVCNLTYENAQKSDLKVIKQADTIEELIQCGDLIKVDMKKLKLSNEDIIINYTIKEFKGEPNNTSYGLYVERSQRGDYDKDFTWLEEFIDCKGIIALYIEQKNGDFKKIAEVNEKGELELL